MFGIENLLTMVFGDNTLLFMLAGFVGLITMNLVIKVIIEVKKKNLNWYDLPEFIKPVMLYGAFLVGMEFFVATAKGFPAVYELFQGVQIIGYVAVMGKYFKSFYSNLKEIGMPTDESIDGVFEDKLNSITGETRDEIVEVVEEYLARKNKEAN